jgi:hypothetical protein
VRNPAGEVGRLSKRRGQLLTHRHHNQTLIPSRGCHHGDLVSPFLTKGLRDVSRRKRKTIAEKLPSEAPDE